MSSMLGSGVRSVLVDESFQSFDTVSLDLMVPMMTKKGAPGELNTVNISNYQDVLGYDLDYNGNYLGLAALLGSVSEVNVLRLNLDPLYSNVVIFKDGTYYNTDDITDPETLQAVICLREGSSTLASSLTKTVAINETIVAGSFKVYLGGVLYATDDGEGALEFTEGHTTVASGTLSYDASSSLTITFPTGTTNTATFTYQYTHDSDAALVVYTKTPGDWDDLSIRIARYYETLENFATSSTLTFTLPAAVAELDAAYRVEDISGNTLATSGTPSNHSATITGTGVTGTINFTTLSVSLTFNSGTFPAADYPMLLSHRYILDDPYYLLTVLRVVNVGGSTSYLALESNRISLSSSLEDFAETVEFENISIVVLSSLTVTDVGKVTPVAMLYGDDGTVPSASELDFSGVDATAFNLICMNGILGASIISAFVAYFEAYNIMTLWDIPNVATYVAAKSYHDSVYASEFQMGYWVSDQVTVGTRTFSIYPSVKVAQAYARMFKRTGTLNYPPAGYDFAAVAATSLLATDAALHAADLKQAKINYLIAKSSGPVVWEQRTGYASESDLSYGSTVMCYVAFASRMKAFMENFPFRFVTPELLVTITTGLESIATDYITNGFVWSATVDVPSFAEVKAAGARYMTINVSVKFAEDGEEFTFNFHIKATA